MGVVLTIVNQKGGVGKTTTAVNLAAGLAMLGDGALLIDADPQGNALSGVGIERKSLQKTLFEVLLGNIPIQEAIMESRIPNLSVLPSSLDLAGIDILMAHRAGRELILKNALFEIRDAYQWIIIDTPPSLGLITLNSLAASDGLILPLQCEYYALEGVTILLKTIELVRQHLNPRLTIRKVLLTMRDTRTRLGEQVEREIRDFFGPRVARAMIPRNVRVSEAPSYGQPVLLYDPRSKGAKAYQEFVKEVKEDGTSWAW